MGKRLGIGTVMALLLLCAALTYTLTRLELANEVNSLLETKKELSSDAAIKKFDEAMHYIESGFIGEYDKSRLMDAAIKGLVSGLDDKWSHYLTAEEAGRLRQASSNRYVGIGVKGSQQDGTGVVITKVYPDSPAYKAGVRVGDRIVSVEGAPVLDMTYEEMAARISGEQGTSVEITFSSAITGEYTRTLIRDNVLQPAVTSELLDGGIGLITIENFDERVGADFSASIQNLQKAEAMGLIIDVRDNPGGKLETLVSVLDTLLPEGTIFIDVDKSGKEITEKSGASEIDLPMAVLINEQSISAAEYFAAALQEYGKATLIGRKTLGKGYSQNILELSDGSALMLSTRKYLTPHRVSLIGVGVTPDIIVAQPPSDGAPAGIVPREKDAQFQRAVAFISSEIEAASASQDDGQMDKP